MNGSDKLDKNIEGIIEEKKKEHVNFRSIHSPSKIRAANFSALTKVQLEKAIGNFRSPVSYSLYTRERILNFLKTPQNYSKELRKASVFLYYSNIHYWRLIQYFARMSPLMYWLSPVKMQIDKADIKKIQTSYKKATDYLSTMNFRHEMQKVLSTVFREDVFYGYAYVLKDSFFLRQLDGDYCKITSCDDGCYSFSFDFSYFNGHKDELEYYGEDFISRFNIYEKDSNQRWQELPSENEFCIKIQEEVLYPVVPFASTFDDLYELKDYKTLQKAKTEIQNYKILGLELPMDEDGVVLHETSEIDDFYGSLENVLPENIGIFMTPYKVQEFTFERAGTADTDLVDEATNNFMNSAGVSNLLFNSKSSTSSTLPFSIQSDATIVYSLHRQIERSINRLLKRLPGTQKFAINVIDCTYYNMKEKLDELLKLGQYGFPVRSQIAALSGILNNDLSATCFLENEILGLSDMLIPLKSSTNSSAEALESIGNKKKAGAPKKENPSDKTLENQKKL